MFSPSSQHALAQLSLLLLSMSCVKIPKEVTELHHEVELGIVIGDTGRDVAEEDAMKLVSGSIKALLHPAFSPPVAVVLVASRLA